VAEKSKHRKEKSVKYQKKIQFSLILNLVGERNIKKKIQKTKRLKKNANGHGVETQIREKKNQETFHRNKQIANSDTYRCISKTKNKRNKKCISKTNK
jgi:hypothetical protein